MTLSPALKYGLLSFLYTALALVSLHALWPLLPQPGFVWSLLLALIPGLLMLFAFALLERDGVLMLVAWVAGSIAVASFGMLSGNLAAQAARWLDLLV